LILKHTLLQGICLISHPRSVMCYSASYTEAHSVVLAVTEQPVRNSCHILPTKISKKFNLIAYEVNFFIVA